MVLQFKVEEMSGLKAHKGIYIDLTPKREVGIQTRDMSNMRSCRISLDQPLELFLYFI